MFDKRMMVSQLGLMFDILFVLFVSTAAAAPNGAASSQGSSGRDEFQQTAMIVVASTFSVGLVVGGLWCYCMSAVCHSRQCDQKQKGRLSAPRREDYLRRHYTRSSSLSRSDSPTLSTSSTSTSSHIP